MASEKRLIDANALLETIDKSDRDNFHKCVANRSIHHFEHIHFMEMVLNAPTADAVEVVHGEWIVCGDGKYVPHMCSVCGKTAKLWYADEPYKYCPNCGADMRGKTE